MNSAARELDRLCVESSLCVQSLCLWLGLLVAFVFSVEDVVEVVIVQELDVLLASSTKAIKEVVDVGLRELVGVLEAGHVVVDVVVLLNSLHNVPFAVELEHLLCEHHVLIVDSNHEVAQVALGAVEVGWVAERTLVVGHGPLGCRHNAQVVVPVGVHARNERVLREPTSLNLNKSIPQRYSRPDSLPKPSLTREEKFLGLILQHHFDSIKLLLQLLIDRYSFP